MYKVEHDSGRLLGYFESYRECMDAIRRDIKDNPRYRPGQYAVYVWFNLAWDFAGCPQSV